MDISYFDSIQRQTKQLTFPTVTCIIPWGFSSGIIEDFCSAQSFKQEFLFHQTPMADIHICMLKFLQINVERT